MAKEGERAEGRRYDEVFAQNARNALAEFVRDHGGQIPAAKLLGCNQGTLSRDMQAHKQPSLRVLVALAERTGRTVDDILGRASVLPAVTLRPEDLQAVVVAVRAELAPFRRLTVHEPTSEEVAHGHALVASHRVVPVREQPTALEFAGADVKHRWSRTEVAAVMITHGRESRKTRDEWLPLFRLARKEVRTKERFRKGHVEKRKKAEVAAKSAKSAGKKDAG